jgi:hypothetical protein
VDNKYHGEEEEMEEVMKMKMIVMMQKIPKRSLDPCGSM